MQAVETLGGITPMYLAAAVTDGKRRSFPSGSVTMTGIVGLGMVSTFFPFSSAAEFVFDSCKIEMVFCKAVIM